MRRQPKIEDKLRAAFEKDKISHRREHELEKMLNFGATGARPRPGWFASLGWALAAALFVAIGVQNFFSAGILGLFSSDREPSSLHDQRVLELTALYPADFEIQDDLQGLEPIVRNYFSDSSYDFEPSMPEHILSSYIPLEGRLLTWHGSPAVSVNLAPRASKVTSDLESEGIPTENARLFIVHTPKPGRAFFDVMPTSVPTPFAWRPSGSDSSRPQYGRIWRDASSTYIVVGQGDSQ